MIENIVNTFIENIDITYILVINILTYIVIKFIDCLNKEKTVSVWNKRLILLSGIIIVTSMYILLGYDKYIILLNSAILTPISWSFIIKPILKKFNIDYKNIENK